MMDLITTDARIQRFTFLLSVIGFLALLKLPSAAGLECYACEGQDGNKDKCVKTTKQCEQGQDICRSSVSWILPRYWTPYGIRAHYVSKDCDTLAACEALKATLLNRCRRDWYADWECVDCCQGDLCNYYVTLSATHTRSLSALSLSISAVTALSLCSWLL